MTKYFDSHAHLTDEWLGDVQDVIEAAKQANVAHILDVASDLENSAGCMMHAKKYAGIHATAGLHPHASQEIELGSGMERLKLMAYDQSVVAVGEMGLDYHYDQDWKNEQFQWFRAQLDLAAEVDKPVVIHDREAHGDMLSILREFKGKVRGVIHSYSASYEMAMECIKMGYYISFSGSLTFKNTPRLKEVAKRLPLSSLMIETDSPYLSPVPVRKVRPNQPAHVIHIAKRIADLQGIEVDEVARVTYDNACDLFSISKQEKGILDD